MIVSESLPNVKMFSGDVYKRQFANLDTVSKLQILQERRLLAESGRISYASLVALLDLVEKEESFLIAQAKSQILAGLKRFRCV